MTAWSRLSHEVRGTQVLFVFRNAQAVREVCGSGPPPAPVAVDPGGEAGRSLNALWSPRAYALEAGGRLAYVQPATTPDAQAPLEVKHLWRQAR